MIFQINIYSIILKEKLIKNNISLLFKNLTHRLSYWSIAYVPTRLTLLLLFYSKIERRAYLYFFVILWEWDLFFIIFRLIFKGFFIIIFGWRFFGLLIDLSIFGNRCPSKLMMLLFLKDLCQKVVVRLMLSFTKHIYWTARYSKEVYYRIYFYL